MASSVTTLSNQYFTLSGTSMATPVVSGAAALLIQQYPNLTPDQVKARLMKTASKTFPASTTVTDPTTGIRYTDYYDIFTIGAGYLNIPAALANNDLANGSAMSPSVTFDQCSQTVYLVEGHERCLGQQRGLEQLCSLGYEQRLGLQRRVGHRRCLGRLLHRQLHGNVASRHCHHWRKLSNTQELEPCLYRSTLSFCDCQANFSDDLGDEIRRLSRHGLSL
jgi:hypothetical protein